MTPRWRLLGLVALGLALSGFFVVIMRPPGAQPSTLGQALPWQAVASPDGATLTVFGLTVGQSTLGDAVAILGRRYDLAVFADSAGALTLEAYFRDVLIGGLNARMVLTGQLPSDQLEALRRPAGAGQALAEGGHRYPISEADTPAGLLAVITAIVWVPVARFDAALIQKHFGQPTERLQRQEGTHWLYPALGLDLLLNAQGQTVLQYVPPVEFARRLRAPLDPHQPVKDS